MHKNCLHLCGEHVLLHILYRIIHDYFMLLDIQMKTETVFWLELKIVCWYLEVSTRTHACKHTHVHTLPNEIHVSVVKQEMLLLNVI